MLGKVLKVSCRYLPPFLIYQEKSAGGRYSPPPSVKLGLKDKSTKWLYHIVLFRMEYLLLGRSRFGVRVGVGVDVFRSESESESESLKICRLRGPAF